MVGSYTDTLLTLAPKDGVPAPFPLAMVCRLSGRRPGLLKVPNEEQRVREEEQKARVIRANGENDLLFITATALKGTAA